MLRIFSAFNNLVLATLLLIAFAFVGHTQAAFFDSSKDQACKGATITSGGGGCDAAAGTKINSVITQAVNILSIVVGIIAVVMIIVGGAKLITSGGDSNKLASGRSTIIYAIIGLVVVVLAQIIVHFVLTKTSKVTGP